MAPGELADALHRRAAAREETAARLGELEPCRVGADPEVRVPHHLETARRADPVDRGDNGLVERELRAVGQRRAVTQDGDQGVRHRVRRALLRHLRLAGLELVGPFGDDRDEALQVRPDAVHVADAGEDGDPRLVVVAEADPRVGELAEVLEVEGVPPLGPVDRDRDDATPLLVVDRHRRCLHRSLGATPVAAVRPGC